MTAKTLLSMTPKATQESSASSSSFNKPLDVVCDKTDQQQQQPSSTSNSNSNNNNSSSSSNNKIVDPKCMPPSGPAGMVTFSKRVRVKKVRSYRNYTQAELNATWHSPDDYHDIKSYCIRTLKLMHQDPTFVECKEYCVRGLEVRAKKAAQQRKENRTFATNAVLDEQDHQEETNLKDDERIRQVYREISATSQITAESVGRKDFDELFQREICTDQQLAEYRQLDSVNTKLYRSRNYKGGIKKSKAEPSSKTSTTTTSS